MAKPPALRVLVSSRRLRLAVGLLILFMFTPAKGRGQNQSGASLSPLPRKPEPGKVWTEDDLAGLLKPWDLYQIAQEKKSALAATATAPAPVLPEASARSSDSVPQPMDSRGFEKFLKMLDADAATWQARLKNIDIGSLGLEYQEQDEMDRLYDTCQEALERIRDEVAKLSQDQTLKLDVLLLIDLNTLSRSLDGLSVNLASPLTVQDKNAVHKSLGWAQEVLVIDQALAPRINEFQYHALAFAQTLGEALERAQQAPDQVK